MMAQFISDNIRDVFTRSVSVEEVQHQIDLFEPYCRAFLKVNEQRYIIHRLTDNYRIKLNFEPWNNEYATIIYENLQGKVFQGVFHLMDIGRNDLIMSAHLLGIVLTSNIILTKSQFAMMERSIHPFVAVNVIVMAMVAQRKIQQPYFEMLMKRTNIRMVSAVHCLPLEYLLLVYGEDYHVDYLIKKYPEELPRILSDYSHCVSDKIIKKLEDALE